MIHDPLIENTRREGWRAACQCGASSAWGDRLRARQWARQHIMLTLDPAGWESYEVPVDPAEATNCESCQ